MSAVRLITDGACLDNGREDPRGGWAAILVGPEGGERVLTGAEAPSTNNRMELTAAIEGLAAAPAGSDVEVLTDSAYLANGVNQGWIENWKRKGWVTAAKKPVANRPLWERLDAEIARHHSVRFRHVRGHAGHAENERADRLAQDAALRAEPGTGPGGDSDGQLELGL